MTSIKSANIHVARLFNISILLLLSILSLSVDSLAHDPEAPTNLASLVDTHGQISLLWTDNAHDEDGFIIERSDAGEPFIKIASVAANVTTYKDSIPFAQLDKKFSYRVASYHLDGVSRYSNTILVTPIKPIYIYKNLGNIEIDGRLVEQPWTSLSLVSATKKLQGASDNAVDFGMLWDRTYLYVGVRVFDKDLYRDSVRPEDDDSVAIFIDANHSHRNPPSDAFDRYIVKAFGSSEIFEGKGNISGIQHAVTQISGGYTVEIAIPWSNLGVTPENDMALGLDVGNYDDDNGGEGDGQEVWVGSVNNPTDTSDYGHSILLARGVGVPAAPSTIALGEGWNLISLPQQPANTAIGSVLSTIRGKYSAVFSYNALSATYESYDPDNASGSKLQTMEAGRGYWIYVTSPSTLHIAGRTPVTEVLLYRGWNLVGFNSPVEITVTHALQTISNEVSVIYEFNNSKNAYVGYQPPDTRELRTLTPGKGYWVYSSDEIKWSIIP
jgi:hypothetical protein